MTVWPCDQPRPEASNLNFVKGRDVPNLVTVKLSTSGSVCLLPTAATHVLADVAGYTTAVTETEWGVDFA